MNNIFGNNNNSNNPFGGGNTNQGNNPFMQGGNNNQNQTNANPFASFSQNNNQNSIFSNNNNNNNPFGNNNQNQNQNTQGGNIFGNNQNQQNNNIFGQNNNNQNNMFSNNQQTNNPFANNNNQGGNNMFGNNNNQNQGGNNNMFNNNQNNNMFNNQSNQGNQGNIFNNNQGMQNNNQPVGANPFNQPNVNPNMNGMNYNINNNNMGMSVDPRTLLINNNLTQAQIRQINNRNLQQNLKIIQGFLQQLDSCKLSENNDYRHVKVNTIPELKVFVLNIKNQINIIKGRTRDLKKEVKLLQQLQRSYIQQARAKLKDYKECLIQRLSQDSIFEGINQQINELSNEIDSFFKPLLNAYSRGQTILFADPGNFELNLSYLILKKMQILKLKIEDLEACQGDKSGISDTIQIFDQLLQYYQNVSLLFKDFITKYTDVKKKLIESKKKISYEQLMKQLDRQRVMSMGKGYKHYQIVKNISNLLDKKQELQRQNKRKTTQLQNRRR